MNNTAVSASGLDCRRCGQALLYLDPVRQSGERIVERAVRQVGLGVSFTVTSEKDTSRAECCWSAGSSRPQFTDSQTRVPIGSVDADDRVLQWGLGEQRLDVGSSVVLSTLPLLS